MYLARRCSGQCVMACPARLMVPRSGVNEPATALSSVDFPDPFVPMMIRNEPCGSSSDTSESARTSLTVPRLNVFDSRLMCSTLRRLRPNRPLALTEPAHKIGHHERREHENRRDQLEVVRIEPPAQGDRHQQPEQHGAHHRAGDEQPDGAAADERSEEHTSELQSQSNL